MWAIVGSVVAPERGVDPPDPAGDAPVSCLNPPHTSCLLLPEGGATAPHAVETQTVLQKENRFFGGF